MGFLHRHPARAVPGNTRAPARDAAGPVGKARGAGQQPGGSRAPYIGGGGGGITVKSCASSVISPAFFQPS